METATLAGGCFWCTEAIFKRLKGVDKVTPGYSGGDPAAAGGPPTYYRVAGGDTGHAEAIQLEFDPQIISYEKLLEVFFKLHDPTTLNKQDYDSGTEYRSIVFYHDQKQKETAERVKKMIEDEKVYSDPIVTEIVPFEKFFPAEEYHKDFYEKNSSQPYCRIIIDPKITKLYKEFKDVVKET